MPATVNAKTVRAVLGVAKAVGLDASELARTRAGRDALGIDAAEGLPRGHWDVIDYLLGTADTLGTGLRRFERYFAIISTGVQHLLEQDKDTVRIVRRYAPDCQTRLLAPAEFGFAATVAHMRIALDASGDSTIEGDANVEKLSLDVSGNSRATLTAVRAVAADVSLSGTSSGSLTVERTLDYDVSGGSHLVYFGNPQIGKSETSGGSSVERH